MGLVKVAGLRRGLENHLQQTSSSQYFLNCLPLFGGRTGNWINSCLGEKYPYEKTEKHFITADLSEQVDLGKVIDGIYVLKMKLRFWQNKMAVLSLLNTNLNRSSYLFLGQKFEPDNIRLLHRATFMQLEKKRNFADWLSSNINVECILC